MIKKSYLNKQLKKSRKCNQTSSFLIQLVFQIVDEVLSNHYEESYSDRCLQSSLAIQQVLAFLGIDSYVYGTDFCIAQAYEGSSDVIWGGFWDTNHHVWVVTEFDETVDLSVSQSHKHSSNSRPNQLPIPAIWWQRADEWPEVIKYLQSGVINPELSDAGNRDLQVVSSKIDEMLATIMNDFDVRDISFQPIIQSPRSLEDLLGSNHSWAKKVYLFNQSSAPLPPWIQEKERQLTHQRRRALDANKT